MGNSALLLRFFHGVLLEQALPLALDQLPEWRVKAQAPEERLSLFARGSLPSAIAPVIAIPRIGQPPTFTQTQDRAALEAPIAAPLIDVLFRPEEKHCFSIEDDVVPPVGCGNREVRHAGIVVAAIPRD